MPYYINDKMPHKKYFVGMDGGRPARREPNYFGANVITEYENGAYKTKLSTTREGCDQFIQKLVENGWRRIPI